MHFTADDVKPLQFKKYRKTALTQAYQLTEQDYEERGGVIETLEGPASFEPGDWLCTGINAEQWPVPASLFPRIFEEARRDGNSVLYRTKGVKEAVQLYAPFTVTMDIGAIHHGEPGDYLARTPGGLHIVNREIFEASHELVQEEPS